MVMCTGTLWIEGPGTPCFGQRGPGSKVQAQDGICARALTQFGLRAAEMTPTTTAAVADDCDTPLQFVLLCVCMNWPCDTQNQFCSS